MFHLCFCYGNSSLDTDKILKGLYEIIILYKLCRNRNLATELYQKRYDLLDIGYVSLCNLCDMHFASKQ